MGMKFNPITGELDLVGSGSGSSPFTETEGAQRSSDDIDVYTYSIVMRASDNSDWSVNINTDGSLQSLPVLQEEDNSRLLDESGDIIIGA